MWEMSCRRAKCVLFFAGAAAGVFGAWGQETEVRAAVSVIEAAQLYEAAENGGEIFLENDLELPEPVRLAEDTRIYGNGYELRFASLGEEESGLVFSGGTQDEPCVLEDVIVTGDGAAGDGVFVEPDAALEMSEVSVSGFFQGVSVYGELAMTDCRIAGHEDCGILIHADGSARMEGGEVSGNAADGVRIEGGTFRQEGGRISGNGRYGIYQNGRYEMAEDAAVEEEDGENYLFLAEQHVIRLTEEPSSSGVLGCIQTASDDRRLARSVVELEGDAADADSASLNGRFTLAFAEVTTDEADGEGLPDAAVRRGNGVNAPESEMILSGTLAASFETGLTQEQTDSVPGFAIADMPEEERFYWMEEHTFQGLREKPLPQKSLLDADGKEQVYAIDGSMRFGGWTSNIGLHEEPLSDVVTVPAERLGAAVEFTAVWDFLVDALFCGNGQTNGDEAPDFELYDLSAEAVLPDNAGQYSDAKKPEAEKDAAYFKKEYQWRAEDQKRYDKNREAYVDCTEQYAFAGWSKRTDGSYKDEDLFRAGDPLRGGDAATADGTEWFLGELAQVVHPHGRTESEGKVEICFCAVWDCFPEIDALDRYFLLSDAAEGRITEEELLKKAEAADAEDGMLANGTQLRLADFDPDDLLGLGDVGSVSVRYEATDLAGNRSYYDVAVHIANDEGGTARTQRSKTGRRPPVYTRFISKEFYELGLDGDKDESIRDAYDAGALEPYSVWYRKEKYRRKLEQAFSGLERGEYGRSYSYSQSAIQSAQAFLRSDEGRVPDDSFRKRFADAFVRPAQK